MPEAIRCDACETTAPRPLAYPAPAGWFYLKFSIENLGDAYVYACSAACRQTLDWKPGPGPRLPEAEQILATLRGRYPCP